MIAEKSKLQELNNVCINLDSYSTPYSDLRHDMRKPVFCICENTGLDSCAADQHLCFRYIDSTIPLLSKSEISRFQPSYVVEQSGLCQTWLKPEIGTLS